MTRGEFKKIAMNILRGQTWEIGDKKFALFDSDNIDNYKVAQYDDEEWDVEADYELEYFLDELYEALESGYTKEIINALKEG